MMVEDDTSTQSMFPSNNENISLFGQQSNQNSNQNTPFRGGRGGQTPRGRGRGRGNNSQDAMLIEDDSSMTPNNNNTNSLFGGQGSFRGGRGGQTQRGRGRSSRPGGNDVMMMEDESDNSNSNLFGNSSPFNNNNTNNNNFNKKPQKIFQTKPSFDVDHDINMAGDNDQSTQNTQINPRTRNQVKVCATCCLFSFLVISN